MLRLCAVALILVAFPREVLGNGRPPATASITFRLDMESHVVAGLTFGLVMSRDNGSTWTWQCEDAIGYGGTYDPDYAWSPSGALFATTFDGLKVNRDGCAFETVPLTSGMRFFSRVTVAPDGLVLAAASDPMDGKIYRSTDDGTTFPTSTMPGQPADWWQSIEVAPSNPSIVYLAGHRIEIGDRKFLLLRSVDGGQSFQPLPGNATSTPGGIVGKPDSLLEIAGISSTDPNVVFARLLLSDNELSDAIYRSTDGGMSWTKILEKPGTIAFLVRANGQLVAGTQKLGSLVSNDSGASWAELTAAPQIGCLAENSAGEVWACTQNYGTAQMPGDGFGIMKTTDLQAWTGVLRYDAIAAPEACPDGTVQKDRCDAEQWCGLCSQLGCTPARECPDLVDGTPARDRAGCCESGDGGVAGTLALVGIATLLLARRRVQNPVRSPAPIE